jgi:hypothetical protein
MSVLARHIRPLYNPDKGNGAVNGVLQLTHIAWPRGMAQAEAGDLIDANEVLAEREPWRALSTATS